MQHVQVPRPWIGGWKRGAVAAALVTAGLAIGSAIGRETAPSAAMRPVFGPATTLTALGPRSIGDIARARYHLALGEVPVLAATGRLSPGDATRVRMFAAMNGSSRKDDIRRPPA